MGKSGSFCDALKPGSPLTTRQSTEDSWMSDNPIPYHRVPFSGTHDLTKIGQSLICTWSFSQNTTCTKKPDDMAQYNTMTPLGPIMGESDLTGPTHPHYRIYRTNYHSSQEFNYNTLTNITNYNKVVPKYFYKFFTQNTS